MTTKEIIIKRISDHITEMMKPDFMDGYGTDRDEKKIIYRHSKIIYKLATALIVNESNELAMAVKERSDDSSLIYLADALMARITSK